MSNYTSGNLINVSASEVPVGTLAMKIGNDFFIAGCVNITSTYNVTSTYNITSNFIEQIGDAYVVVDDNGTLKAQKLAFDNTTASDSGEPETLENVMIFNTGHDQPEYEGNTGNVMDFYKCNLVDSTNQTWTGYKAIFNSTTRIYSFQETVTSGLTYSIITPEIGKIYENGTLIQAKLYTGFPENGLVYFAPLQSDVNASQTGQDLTKIGSDISYQTYKGIPCVKLTNNSYIKSTNNLSSIPTGSAPFTISVWCCLSNTSNSYGSFAFGYGNASSFNEAGIWFDGLASNSSNGIAIDFHNNEGFETGAIYEIGKWYHCCLVWDGTLLRSYVNGIATNIASKTVNMGTSIVTIGIRGDNTPNYSWDGYVAGCRIYNRALTTTEIAALAAEFTPTQS